MEELKTYSWKRPIFIELITFLVVVFFVTDTIYILFSHKNKGNQSIAFTLVVLVLAILVVIYDALSVRRTGKTTLKIYDDRIIIKNWNFKEKVIMKQDIKDVNIPRYNEGLRINLKNGKFHSISLRGLKKEMLVDLVTTLVTYTAE
jgi:hypothetical protein